MESDRPTSKSVLAYVLALSLGFAVVPVANAIRKPEFNKDYSLWYGIGIEVRNDRPLYQPGKNGEVLYMYPPTAAVVLFAPLSYLGPVGFVVVFAAATGVSWGLSLYLAIQLATGRWLGHPRWFYALALLAIGPYVYDLFLLGQVNLILLMLSLMAMRDLARRPLVAGVWLGIAIAIKVFPLPILVYWAARREWRAIGATILTVVLAVVVLPGFVRGFERNVTELNEWGRLMVGDQSGETMAARSSVGFSRRNQSLIAVAHRWTRDVEAGNAPGDGVRVNLWNGSPRIAQLVGLGGIAALGFVVLIATRCRFAVSPEAHAIEVTMILILVVLASPLSWTYFFCWLLPAWVVIANACRTRRWCIAPAILCGVLLFSAITEQFDPRLQAYGVTAWGAVGLYLLLATLRARSESLQIQ